MSTCILAHPHRTKPRHHPSPLRYNKSQLVGTSPLLSAFAPTTSVRNPLLPPSSPSLQQHDERLPGRQQHYVIERRKAHLRAWRDGERADRDGAHPAAPVGANVSPRRHDRRGESLRLPQQRGLQEARQRRQRQQQPSKRRASRGTLRIHPPAGRDTRRSRRRRARRALERHALGRVPRAQPGRPCPRFQRHGGQAGRLERRAAVPRGFRPAQVHAERHGVGAACELFLSKQHNNGSGGGGGGGLRFSVTGHSLGGTVAMGVMVLLHDIPTTARRRPNDTRYQQQVLGAWNAERANWSGAAAPYELVGGHIFNPGAWPGLVGPVAGGSAVAGFWLTGAFTLTGAAATAAMCAVTVGSGCALALYLYRSHTERLSDRVDKRVTTHHIIGDVVSGFFRLGTEKNYMPKDKRARRLATACSPGKMGKEWGCHSIANFLFPDSAETLPAAAYLEQKESQELQQALLLSKGSNVAGEGSAAAAPEGAAGAWATTNYGDYDEEEIREALRRSAAESEGGAWEEESWEEFADMMAGSMLTNEDQEVCAAIRRSVADTAAAEVAGMTANSMLTNEDEKVWEALCRSFADMVPETRRVAEEEVWEEFANMTASTLACEDLEILEALRRSVSDTAVTSREAGEEEVWDEFTDMATVSSILCRADSLELNRSRMRAPRRGS